MALEKLILTANLCAAVMVSNTHGFQTGKLQESDKFWNEFIEYQRVKEGIFSVTY